MAVRTFFSFHYQRDIWRVNIVRNSNVIDGAAAAGWHDASLWEESKRKGDAAIKRLIDDGLRGTSTTVVCIGAQTANRRYVDYEIQRSHERGNYILGLYIDHLRDRYGQADVRGAVPRRLLDLRARVITFTTAADLGRELLAIKSAQARGFA